MSALPISACAKTPDTFSFLVAQELYCHGFSGDEHKLHYFNSKKQGELDFVIVQDGVVIPIEVKSGKNYDLTKKFIVRETVNSV